MHTRYIPGAPSSGDQNHCATWSHKRDELLHKTTVPVMGVITDLPNT